MTYYDILEISPSASEDVIRMAYKALAKKYHPDVFIGDKAVAEKKMKEINEAYEILSDAAKRKAYDSTLSYNTANHESTYDAQRDNTTASKQQANDEQTHKQTVQSNSSKKVPFFFQWKFIILALFVFSGTENSILIFIGLALAVIRFAIGLIRPQYKLHGFKKLAAFVCCTLAILSVIGALSSDTPNNNTSLDTDNTTQSTNDSGSNDTEDNNKETMSIKVVTDVNGYTSLKKFEIENVYGIYDGKILINTSDSDEYMCIDISSGKIIEKFTGSIKEDAFEHGYIGYYDHEKSENIIKKIDGSKVVIPDSECRIVEELFEEEIFIISRQRTDYEYSGYELAAVSFSGEMVMDWIAPPIDGVIIDVLCHDMGEGIIYLGEDNYPSFQDEQGTSYFLNVYTGETFQWPEDAPRLDKIIRGTEPSLISTFKNGSCIGYRNYISGPYTTATEYFRFDLQNGYQVLSNIGGGETPVFVRGAGTFYQYGYLGKWTDGVKWSIYDMTGNEAFDTSNYTIQSFNAFIDCFGLVVSSENGNQDANFFTVVNLEGEELFAPINCTGMIVRQFNEDKIFCLIDGEKATFYNYNGEKIGDIGKITETEKGLIFSSKQTYSPIDIEIIDGYIVGCFVNKKGNQRHFIGTLDYSEKEIIIEQTDLETQTQPSDSTAAPDVTTSPENNNSSTNDSTETVNSNGISQSENANQELSSFYGKWILDEEWYMQFSEGYFSSSYQDGPLRVDNYYFEDGKLHIYFSLDPFDTGYVWCYYGVMDGNTLALSMDGEGGYGAPELYYRDGSSAPDIGILGDIKEHGNNLCGYDYNGNELYVGYVVRIGADHEGTQYAVGTIVGWTDVGTVQVKFTDVLAVDEYGQTDPYFIEGIADELAQNGESIQFVDSRTLQILIFG